MKKTDIILIRLKLEKNTETQIAGEDKKSMTYYLVKI